MCETKKLNQRDACSVDVDAVVRQFRKVTGITTDEISDEKLKKIYSGSLLMKRIEIDVAIEQLKKAIVNELPNLKKMIESIKFALKKIGKLKA